MAIERVKRLVRHGQPQTRIEHLDVLTECQLFDDHHEGVGAFLVRRPAVSSASRLGPVVASTIDWGQRWFVAPEGPALKLVHRECGRAFHPRLICDQCGERLRGASVQVVRSATEQAGA